MPPNLKFPKDFVATDFGDEDLEAASLKGPTPPAHAAPLATLEDVLPSTTKEGAIKDTAKQHDDDNDYFHHDIEDETTTFTAEEQLSSEEGRKAVRHVDDDEEERRVVRKAIRKYSSSVRNPAECTIDEQRLQHALKDVGMYAYGIQGIAVWQFDDDHDRLVSPMGGFWYHPDNVTASDALERLVDNSRLDHVSMVPVAPGVDIAGVLWLESDSHSRVASFIQRATSLPQLASPKHSTNSLGGLFDNPTAGRNAMVWRELGMLVQDPDTAKGPRMELLEQAGFGQAVGIRFKSELSSGLVIFFAKADADQDLLNGTANVAYLRQSAQFIGSAAAMTEPRRAIVGHQLEKQLSTGDAIASHTEEDREDEEMPKAEVKIEDPEGGSKCFAHCNLCHRVKVWLFKSRGGGLQIPPSLSFRQSLWTALGAFIGLLVLSSLNEYYKYLSNDEYALLIGPFGAMVRSFSSFLILWF